MDRSQLRTAAELDKKLEGMERQLEAVSVSRADRIDFRVNGNTITSFRGNHCEGLTEVITEYLQNQIKKTNHELNLLMNGKVSV